MYVNKKGAEIGQLFSLEMALNIHENGFKIPNTISDCKKGENMKHFVSPSLIWNKKMGRRQLARSSLSVARQVISCVI